MVNKNLESATSEMKEVVKDKADYVGRLRLFNEVQLRRNLDRIFAARVTRNGVLKQRRAALRAGVSHLSL